MANEINSSRDIIRNFVKVINSLIEKEINSWNYNAFFSPPAYINFTKLRKNICEEAKLSCDINEAIIIDIEKFKVFAYPSDDDFANELDLFSSLIKNKSLIESLQTKFLAFYINYIKYVERNIVKVINGRIQNINDNYHYKSIAQKYISNPFLDPAFKVYSRDVGEISFGFYKPGEGYKRSTHGSINYYMENNEQHSPDKKIDYEKLNFILKQNKKTYSHIGDRFFYNNMKTTNYDKITIDIPLTRFLLEVEEPGLLFEDRYRNYKENSKIIERQIELLYIIAFIQFCDVQKYIGMIKLQYVKSDGQFPYNYFELLYVLNEVIIDGSSSDTKNIYIDSYILRRMNIHGSSPPPPIIPEIEFIKSELNRKFKNIDLDRYLNNYLINNSDAHLNEVFCSFNFFLLQAIDSKKYSI